MKLAIPVNDCSMEANICILFGRAPYFLIYDTKTKESRFLDNSSAAVQEGAGRKAAQRIVDEKVDALLTPRCGKSAAELIQSADIRIYEIDGTSLQANLSAFTEGKLTLLADIHDGLYQQRKQLA
ncbi:MAG: NifB/NifX family molybdenum-iron cluster-binding protein [Negativicutes bacterium]|nr:NifB/NifX family molybdenum-iron cluster-binding protein [Negativicutes bacterium]